MRSQLFGRVFTVTAIDAHWFMPARERSDRLLVEAFVKGDNRQIFNFA